MSSGLLLSRRKTFLIRPIATSLMTSWLLAVCVPAVAAQHNRVQLTIDTSEADQVLAIFALRAAGKPIDEPQWQQLFATEPYRRLKIREQAIAKRFNDPSVAFTDEDFRKFVASEDLMKRAAELRSTLERWKKADLQQAAQGVLRYLPASAVIRAKVFPVIKPNSNSFVWDMSVDPAIFLYLDPGVSSQKFANTVAHELHHVGLASAQAEYDKRVQALPKRAATKGRPVTDLRKEDVEILEDGVPQRIETFELIVSRAPGSAVERAEPRTVAESNDAAADPRTRLFVLFLDSYHTSIDGTAISLGGGLAGSKSGAKGSQDSPIGHALARLLERTIGPDDLIGLLRPELPVTALTFTRRPASFEAFLQTAGAWQRRFVGADLDEVERRWEACYGQAVLNEMIDRRREQLVFESLRKLVRHLDTLREGRTAILIVSEGWQLAGPNDRLATPMPGQPPPGPPPVGVGPDGKLRIGRDERAADPKVGCERDRVALAQVDPAKDFRDLLDEANRANASFYTIDPRGLPVFDSSQSARSKPVSNARDLSTLRDGIGTLTTLAESTDGLAIVNSNDLDANLRRIQDGTASYYLLGYYSSNGKFDGKFRKITVRVKRSGVEMRARRGYRALTEAEVAARTRTLAAGDTESVARAAALASLERQPPDRALHLAAGCMCPASLGAPASGPGLWLVAELDLAAARQPEWSEGAQLTVTMTAADGQAVGTEQAKISTASRTVLVRLPIVGPGDYQLRARLQGRSGSLADVTEHLRVTVPDAKSTTPRVMGDPLVFRRGPFTGPAFQPTADLRFRKAERVRVQIAVGVPPDAVAARLLDRRGQMLAIPVTATEGGEAGVRAASAEVALAPLAPADYLLEVTVRFGTRLEKALVAFRIVS
jgi:VWFA-related protein